MIHIITWTITTDYYYRLSLQNFTIDYYYRLPYYTHNYSDSFDFRYIITMIIVIV